MFVFTTVPNSRINPWESWFIIFLFYNLFTKSTDKIHCRYEAPREEPGEAFGCLALGCDSYMVALSVDVD
jgi:hypothetical protein